MMKRPARMNRDMAPRGVITSSNQVPYAVNKMITPRSVSARAQSRANFSMNKINVNRNPSINPFTFGKDRNI